MPSATREPAAEYDVIVVGSGIGGVSAALAAAEMGLTVALFEKDDLLGGGTCLSYGGIWVGDNHVARTQGISDSRAAILDYMRFVAGGAADDDLMATFIDQSPIATEFFARCGVEFQLTRGLADHYYPVAPGSTADGRSIEPVPISTDELGEWGAKIRDSFIDPRILTVEEFTTWGGVVNYTNWDHARVDAAPRQPHQGQRPGADCSLSQGRAAREVAIFLATPVERLTLSDAAPRGRRIARWPQHSRAQGCCARDRRLGGRCRAGAGVRRRAGGALAISARSQRRRLAARVRRRRGHRAHSQQSGDHARLPCPTEGRCARAGIPSGADHGVPVSAHHHRQ